MSMEKYFPIAPTGGQVVTIDSDMYHADVTAINASGLKLLKESPLKYWHRNLNPKAEKKEATDAMQFGTLCHSCLFEPETVKEVCKKLGSKTVKKLDDAESIAKAVRENEDCGLIALGIGKPEQTIYWIETVVLDDGEVVQVSCKARLDWMVEPLIEYGLVNGAVFDLKTTTDASEAEFEKQAYNLEYHLSAAWYCRAYFAAFGVIPPFLFIAAEKEEPFDNQVFEEDISNLESGWKECYRLLKLYATCKRDNKWPGYGKGIKTLKRPRWAKENYDV